MLAWALAPVTPLDPGKSAVAAAEAAVYRENRVAASSKGPHLLDNDIGRIGPSLAVLRVDRDRAPRHRRAVALNRPT